MAGSASAYSLQSIVVSNVQPSSDGCTAPPQTSAFSTSDTVYIYFLVQGLNSGDQASARWIEPAGSWTWTTNWNGVSRAGNWCFTGSIAASQLAKTGPWRVEAYLNGQLLGQSSFNIAGPGGSGSGGSGSGGNGSGSASGNTGSFDGINCSHLWGWWKDSNSPTVIASVKIYIDGTLLDTIRAGDHDTIRAGDHRSDLASAGIGNHAFNYYAIPASLKDGQSHRVRVVDAVTDRDLPGSPKDFRDRCGTSTPTSPPPGGGSGAGATAWEYTLSNYGEDLRPFFVRLTKTPTGAGRYQYRLAFTVSQYNSLPVVGGYWKLDSAAVTVVGPRNGGFARKNSRWHVTYDNPGRVWTDNATWYDPPSPPSTDLILGAKAVMLVLGVVVPHGGDPQSVKEYIDEIFAQKTDVGPASWALGAKIEDDERNYAFHVPVDLFKAFGNRVTGAQFTIDDVDETNGQLEFYLRGKDLGGHIFGLEIGTDRRALTWKKNVPARLSPF